MVRVRLATDERRAQLLRLGVDLFARDAYDALTTDAIASEGGISKGLLFHYFGSKRGFYVATIEHVAQLLLDRVVLDQSLAPLASVLDAVERFDQFCPVRRGDVAPMPIRGPPHVPRAPCMALPS